MSTTPQLRKSEQPELPFHGPFFGIQSEMPPDLVETYGFDEAVNIMFRRGSAFPRPGTLAMGTYALTDTIFSGVYTFYNAAGGKSVIAMGDVNTLKYNVGDGTFTSLSAAVFGNPAGVNVGFAALGGKVYFSQGVDKVQVWDGVSGSIAAVSANAVPARFLCELKTYLLVGYTVEAGPTTATQRIRWTSPGDPTDWTTVSAGQTDLFNDLGPITGLIKLGQQAYAFQAWGITQIIPTGNGLTPFDFVPIQNNRRGNAFPSSLAYFGDHACYVGNDNVYLFDGSRSYPIGDAPIYDGSGRRFGARSRIMYDVFNRFGGLGPVQGLMTDSICGVPYNCYILRSGAKIWIYNLDEGNWTTFNFGTATYVQPNFIGIIPSFIHGGGGFYGITQNAQTLQNSGSLTFAADTLMMVRNKVGSPHIVDPYILMYAQACDALWSLKTCPIYANDRRHQRTVSRVRLVVQNFTAPLKPINVLVQSDIGPGTIGGTSNSVTMTDLQGLTKTYIVPINPPVPGTWHTIQVSINGADSVTNDTLRIFEMTPIYDTGGEVRS